MLSDRERRILARIERHLVESDPELARLFAGAHRPADGPTPTFLLVAGITLLVLGSIAAAVPVAVAGMALALVALFTAHARATGFGKPHAA